MRFLAVFLALVLVCCQALAQQLLTATPSLTGVAPGPMTPQGCRETQICSLSLVKLGQCNASTFNIHSTAENKAFQRCICNQTWPGAYRPWTGMFEECLQCFFDNRWVLSDRYLNSTRTLLSQWCNLEKPNVTSFDRIPMVEYVAGTIPPTRRSTGRSTTTSIRRSTSSTRPTAGTVTLVTTAYVTAVPSNSPGLSTAYSMPSPSPTAANAFISTAPSATSLAPLFTLLLCFALPLLWFAIVHGI